MKAGLIILSTLMTQPRSVWVKEKGVKTKKKKEKWRGRKVGGKLTVAPPIEQLCRARDIQHVFIPVFLRIIWGENKTYLSPVMGCVGWKFLEGRMRIYSQELKIQMHQASNCLFS